MRSFHLLTVAVMVAVGLVAAACGGDDQGNALSLRQRVLQANEMPGFAGASKPQTVSTVDAFVDEIKDDLVQASPANARDVLSAAGFRTAVMRSWTDGDRDAEATSIVVRLGSREQARDVLEWRRKDALSPCPGVCNVDITQFEVDDLSNASGVGRVREPGADGAGPSKPFESYEVSFVDGPFLYVLHSAGQPGAIERTGVVNAAHTVHDRVTGRSE